MRVVNWKRFSAFLGVVVILVVGTNVNKGVR